MPPRYDTFRFDDAGIQGHEIRLRYSLLGNRPIACEETLTLPHDLPPPDPEDPIVARLLTGIHEVFALSYFKAAVPATIDCPPVPPEDARFLETLYTEGMGEFWHRNRLDPRGRVHFPVAAETPAPLPAPPRGDEKVLVLIGGGKDSAVAREIVRHAGVGADAISLGTSDAQRRSAEAMGLRHLVIRRKIDPTLFRLNEQGAYNGHVPISALIAFVTLLAAHLGGYSAVIAANERSADEPNTIFNGMAINHQWSKSLVFEDLFQHWCERQLSGGPRYFSILRNLSELGIARLFSTHPHYFERFASCNRNFTQDASDAAMRWCGRCPKCVFAQLILAPFIARETLVSVMGGDFVSEPANRSTLAELTGLEGIKPYECVGTIGECRAALARIAELGFLSPEADQWYERQARPVIGDTGPMWNALLEPAGPERIPAIWKQRLDAYLRSRRA